MATVAVLDYGMSNLRSVAKALQHVAGPGDRILVTDSPAELKAADRFIIPGQGAIGECMARLARPGLAEVLPQCLAERPYLGICLGMQCLMDSSEENGGTPCMGVIPGKVMHFPRDSRDETGRQLKIPHMGWNQVEHGADHPLWQGLRSGERFYFVHSYYVAPAQGVDITGTTRYAIEFAAAVARDNLFAVQFHPEKSQQAGLMLLRNFLSWRP